MFRKEIIVEDLPVLVVHMYGGFKHIIGYFVNVGGKDYGNTVELDWDASPEEVKEKEGVLIDLARNTIISLLKK